jgi:ribonucleotide monophosphatase NagD (HAD superfamily)
VVWRGDTPSRAVEAISRLKAAGKRCVYCTNNSSKTPADYVEKLGGMGIEAEEDDIMTSALAAALYLSSQFTGQFSLMWWEKKA